MRVGEATEILEISRERARGEEKRAWQFLLLSSVVWRLAPRGLRARVPDEVEICGRHFLGLFGQFCHVDEYVTHFCGILW